MPSLSDWLSSANSIEVLSAEDRAVLAWRRIQDRDTSLQLKRAGAMRPAQTFRIEYNNTALWVEGNLVRSGRQQLTLFGVRDHPDPLVVDSDIQRGDRVVINGAEYQVMSVLTPPGEVQALLES